MKIFVDRSWRSPMNKFELMTSEDEKNNWVSIISVYSAGLIN